MRRILLSTVLLIVSCGAVAAQPSQPAPVRAPEAPLRRWFEFQQFVLSTRYQLVRNSSGVTTSSHQQYREQIRFRFNVDARKRYSLNAGVFTGRNYIASWNDLGPGTGDFDGKSDYMRQIYVSAIPVPGLEGQIGSLFVNRGEHTEFTTYDDDGWVTGGRLSVRRPKSLYFDELSVTRGVVASTSTPNVWKRWDDLDDLNYTQLLAAKRFTPIATASMDYTKHGRTDTVRGAVSLRFKPGSLLSSVRCEQYVRVSEPGAAGFAVTAERPVTRWARLQGGYATIDALYGGLNGDRIQRGRRLFAIANVPIHGPLSASIFATHAFDADYTINNKTRLDAALVWDVLNSLRATGKF